MNWVRKTLTSPWFWLYAFLLTVFAGGAVLFFGFFAEVEAQAAGGAAVQAEFDLFKDGIHVVQLWKTVGWLAGIAALSMAALKAVCALKPLRAWLDVRGLLPHVAGGLGALAGAAGALAAKQADQIGTALVSGYLAGLAAVGVHQSVKQPLEARKAAKTGAAGDATVNARVPAALAALDAGRPMSEVRGILEGGPKGLS